MNQFTTEIMYIIVLFPPFYITYYPILIEHTTFNFPLLVACSLLNNQVTRNIFNNYCDLSQSKLFIS